MKTCKRNLHQYKASLKRCPECWKQNQAEWYQTNKDHHKKKQAEWKAKNPECLKKINAEWYTANRAQRKKQTAQYQKNRLKTDPNYKLSNSLRIRLNKALKNNLKSGSAVRDLGCTIPELKSYLEAKFQPGMTWENHGRYGWHIDHIIPLASFDLTDREQFLKANHYSNLQPLWAEDNLGKSDKVL